MQLTMERTGSKEGAAVCGGGRSSVGAADPVTVRGGRRGATMAQGRASGSHHGAGAGVKKRPWLSQWQAWRQRWQAGNHAGAVRGCFYAGVGEPQSQMSGVSTKRSVSAIFTVESSWAHYWTVQWAEHFELG